MNNSCKYLLDNGACVKSEVHMFRDRCKGFSRCVDFKVERGLNINRLKGEFNVDGIVGDFETAINCLLSDLICIKNDQNNDRDSELTARMVLHRWDKNRGNDWFTQTRKDLWGEAE